MPKRRRNSGSANRAKRTKTKSGYWVQSFSEARIDDWLFKQKLNYVYEPVFWIGDKRIVPDWVILPTPELGIEQSIIIEYWGLDYSPSQMNEVSGWVRNAAPKYQKRKQMKEDAYLEMEDYYYISIVPDECEDLDYWLTHYLNQALGFQAFQMEDSLELDLNESMVDNPTAETVPKEQSKKWKHIPRRSDTLFS